MGKIMWRPEIQSEASRVPAVDVADNGQVQEVRELESRIRAGIINQAKALMER